MKYALQLVLSLVGLAFIATPSVALAQTPLRIIVADQAGGGTDSLVRPVANKLAQQLGRPVVVDNKPGAQGRLAGAALLAAPADGNTLMVTVQASVVINPHLSQFPYAPLTDLLPITDLVNASLFLLTPASLAPNNFKEFADWAKQQAKGTMNYGTFSSGTISHFGGLLLAQELGVEMAPVHYKSTPDALKDLLPGTLTFMWSGPAGAVAPLIKNGRLKAHAYMGPKRLAAFPDIPTVRELGMPGLEANGWIGIFAANGVPSDIAAKLHSEIVAALRHPDIKTLYGNIGLEPGGMSNAEFAATVKADSVRWAAYLKKINYKPE
jgi:tripartite-type tricarboxylate transporter receptor subunit TctC